MSDDDLHTEIPERWGSEDNEPDPEWFESVHGYYTWRWENPEFGDEREYQQVEMYWDEGGDGTHKVQLWQYTWEKGDALPGEEPEETGAPYPEAAASYDTVEEACEAAAELMREN